MNVSNQYWAGLFDGEGNVYIFKNLKRIQAIVTQKETPILYLLREKFGGHVYRSTRAHFWRCGSLKETQNFLEAIKPYSIIKAVEIQIALEIMSGMKKRVNIYKKELIGVNGNRSGLAGVVPVSKEELQRRQDLRDAFYVDRRDPKISSTQGVQHA